MANKFEKYFTKSLITEAIPAEAAVKAPVADDKAFAGSFEDENTVGQLEDEISNSTMAPEQQADILRKADKYAENINAVILPTLRKLHDDIVQGVFSSIAPEIKDVSGICEDLARLSEALRGRTRDAMLKSTKSDK